MANLNRDEFFNTLSHLVGDRSDAEAIKALEDMTDTYNALEQGNQGDGIDWKKKAEEIDKSWREKYRSRFMRGDGGNGPSRENNDPSSQGYNPENVCFNDLFGKV